jgi:hypothetical protein
MGVLDKDSVATPGELRCLADMWENGAKDIEREFVPTKPDFQQYADRDRRIARTLRFVADKIEGNHG